MNEPTDQAQFTFEGVSLTAPAGSTVAAGLLGNGVTDLRSTRANGRPRGLFCGIGSCFDCLVDVDESAAVRGCVTLLVDGMRVRRSHSVGGRRAS